MKNILQTVVFSIVFMLMSGCAKNTETPGNLVPPTADQDPSLPQIKIHVAGHDRNIHLQTFGDPADPPVFVLPGGPGADFKLLLPLKALADRFYVVMWDSRGAGLSERVTKEELELDSFDEEISAVKKAMSPDKKVTLIGHSFGGTVMTHYTANHPDEVKNLILIEPGKLDLSLKPTSNGGSISFIDGQDFFWQNELLTSKDHAAADYKALEVLPESSRHWTCDNSIIENYPMWRFGAYHYYMVQKNSYHLPGNYNWAKGIENFKGPVSIIAGTCGALSENFQKETNLKTLPYAGFTAIAGAGHITLFTDFATQTIAAVRKNLAQ
jgi:proline iminopeptidase